jgi:hypothetical protein
MHDCAICKDNADYIMIEGGWYVCQNCIKTGEIDGMGA